MRLPSASAPHLLCALPISIRSLVPKSPEHACMYPHACPCEQVCQHLYMHTIRSPRLISKTAARDHTIPWPLATEILCRLSRTQCFHGSDDTQPLKLLRLELTCKIES